MCCAALCRAGNTPQLCLVSGLVSENNPVSTLTNWLVSRVKYSPDAQKDTGFLLCRSDICANTLHTQTAETKHYTAKKELLKKFNL